jgi:hypothetical protein
MTNKDYTTPPHIATGKLGTEASMEAHIALMGASAMPYRRRFLTVHANDDDGSALFRDKAARLARWHRSSGNGRSAP